MDAQYVWALLGLLCLVVMFAMVVAGVRNVRDEELPDPDREPHE